jgi:restriction system protein
MAIPDFQMTMLPALKAVAIKEASPSKEVIKKVIEHFKLSNEEIEVLLPSKTQRVIDNRVIWALSHMFKAGLVSRPSRGKYSVTEAGKAVLKENLTALSVSYLMRFDSFKAFKSIKRSNDVIEKQVNEAVSEVDPLEQIEQNYQELKTEVVGELLRTVKEIDPTDFEKLIMDLLKKMGYGADDLASVVHSGKSGDGGIDGEISQDYLGLDMIYIQAKRYAEDSGVGRPAIQQFVGSLNERKAKKGIFITSSYFADTVKEYVQKVDVKIVLIDGVRLAELMYEYNLGVEPVQTFEVKRVNSDYFED